MALTCIGVVSTNSVLFNVARTASHSAGVRALAGADTAPGSGSGCGLARRLVSRAAVDREIAAGELEEWRAGPLPLRRRWHLVAKAGEDLPATAELFKDHVLGAEARAWIPTPDDAK